MLNTIKVCGHYEIIGGYRCFVETTRSGKVIHDKQLVTEHDAEMVKVNATLKDLIALSTQEFVNKYGN